MPQVIDVTPTWSGILPVLLDAAQSLKTADGWRQLHEEFARMALAADRWNEHCRSQAAAAATTQTHPFEWAGR